MEVCPCFSKIQKYIFKLIGSIVNNYGKNQYKKKEHNQHSSML